MMSAHIVKVKKGHILNIRGAITWLPRLLRREKKGWEVREDGVCGGGSTYGFYRPVCLLRTNSEAEKRGNKVTKTQTPS